MADTWQTKADFTTARAPGVVAYVNGLIYAIAGQTSGGSGTQTTQAYDPVTNTWSSKANKTTAMGNGAGAVVSGIIYCLGGGGSKNEAYDPAGNSWSTKAALSDDRFGMTAAAINGIVYMAGGAVAGTNDAVCRAYDPVGNSWSSKASMSNARSTPAKPAPAYNGGIYVIGGNNSGAKNYNEFYDATGNSWATKTAIPGTNSGGAAAVVDGRILVIGGSDAGTIQSKIYEYDPVRDSWITDIRATMPAGSRYAAQAAVVGSTVYVIGGFDGSTSYYTRNEAYDASIQKVQPRGSLRVANLAHGLRLL